MATKALVLDVGTTQRVPDAETLIVGVGIDAATATTLTIGGTTATSITLGSATIPVSIPGDVNTLGGTTFQSNATFEGDVTFGNAATDLVTFVSKVNSDIAFNAPGYKITNLANGVNPGDAVNFSQISALVSAVTATAPLLSSGGATPDISIDTAGASNGDVLTYNGAAWAAAAPANVNVGNTFVAVGDGTGIAGSAALTFDSGTTELLVGGGTAHTIKIAPLGAFNNPLIESDDSMNINIANFGGALGMQTGGVDLVLVGGDDGGGMSYLQTQDGVRLETKGQFWMKEQALPSSVTGTGKLAASSTNSALYFVDGAATSTSFLLTPNSVQTGFPTSGAITLDLDPSLTPYKQLGALTGDISFADASNPGAARGITVEIIGDTVSRNITAVPAGWTWLGGAAPTVIEANATAILSLACFGATNNDVVASWSYDGSSSVTGVGVDNQIAVWSGASSLDSSSGLTWNSATAAFAADGSAVFNDSGANRDFRVEAVGNANMLFVDASQASVSIGTTGATHTFNIGSGAAANFCVASGGRIHTYDGSAPTDGQILIGDTAAGNFAKGSLGGGTNITVTPGAGTLSVGLSGQVAVANGGTGQSTLTAGSLVVGDGTNPVNEIAPGSNGEVLTVVGGAWTSAAVPAATNYSVVALPTAQAANTAVTVAGAAAIATAASTSRVAGIVAATNSVQVLGIVTCIVEAARAGQISQGEPVYLSASEAGKVTDVAPSTATQVVAELGIATAADSGGTVTVLWQPKSIVVL